MHRLVLPVATARGGGATALVGLVAMMIGALTIVAPRAEAVTMTRGPLLQNPDGPPDTMTLVWWTDEPGESVVRYGPNPDQLDQRAEGEPGMRHEVTLRGLAPDTQYAYALETDGQVVFGGAAFRTAPPAGATTPVTFAVIGDFGVLSWAHKQLVAQIAAFDPRFVATVGDNAYNSGTQQEIDRHWLGVWQPILPTRLVYPALGNHDVKTDGGAAYLATWVLPANNPARTERYYSADYGNVHLIVLDSNRVDAEQTAWLEQDLAGTTQPWKFAFLHHPPYSCGTEHGSHLKSRKAWSPLFERYGVDVVFCGHEHNYERSRRMDDFQLDGSPGADGKGTHYVVTGGGGNGTYPVTGCETSATASRTYQVMLVTVEGDRASFRSVGPKGEQVDEFGSLKRLAPAS